MSIANKTRKNNPRFAALPDSYKALCRMHLPRRIHDQAEYETTAEVASHFAGFEHKMNGDQTDYFDLLTSLMEEWEKQTVTWPKVSGRELLKHLLENHGMSGADLSRLLGASRTLGPMILRGDRTITAEHARILGTHFALPPGVFIE